MLKMKFLFAVTLILTLSLTSLDSIRGVNNVTTTTGFTTIAENDTTFTIANTTTISISTTASVKIIDVTSTETVGTAEYGNTTAYPRNNNNQTKEEIGLPAKQLDSDNDVYINGYNLTDSDANTKVVIGLLKSDEAKSAVEDFFVSHLILIGAIFASIMSTVLLIIWIRHRLIVRRKRFSNKLHQEAEFEERLLLPLKMMKRDESSVPLQTF